MHIVMVAAENDALPGGKVGGLGDVIRDLPAALAQAGQQVTVITPGYGIFAADQRGSRLASLSVRFAGQRETVVLYQVQAPKPVAGVIHLVLEHPLFSAQGAGRIYITDDNGPFATDAHRFALFCAAVAQSIEQHHLGKPDLLHCHDWHTGLLLALRRFDPSLQLLKSIATVYSIHNLSLQGTRPFATTDSSLSHWFPDIPFERNLIADPRYTDCVNPMRAGINLAQRVHTVSPTYAREILQSSHWEQGQVGGEGLEADLQRVHQQGRLVGILNGCDYGVPAPVRMEQPKLWLLIEKELDVLMERFGSNSASHYYALKQLQLLRRRRSAVKPLLVSVGRLTAQKLWLLVQEHESGSVMDEVLRRLSPGVFVMLGNGDPWYDRFFTRMMRQHGNFLYLCGYSEELAQALYGSGDLFVMPSIYEPCGISQMLAMRAGVPCLVHGVGGLNDTVQHQVNGFSFSGANLSEKVANLLATLDSALVLQRDKPAAWTRICKAAKASRFDWDSAVAQYLEKLYRN